MPTRLTNAWVAAAILAGFWLLMVASLREKSCTVDEMENLTAGYTYWRLGDYRINPENGNLPQRLAALPLLAGDYALPTTTLPQWRAGDGWSFAYEFFYRMNNDHRAMLARGRTAMALVAVALGAVIWFWARRLFGATAAMVALLLFVLNPTMLANGALVTSDTTVTLFLLLATGSWWAMLHRVTVARVTFSGVAMGCLFVAKASAVLILPIAAILLIARVLGGRPLSVEIGGQREVRSRASIAGWGVALAAAHALFVVAVIWSCYGFRYSTALTADSAYERERRSWEFLLNKPGRPLAALLTELNLTSQQQAAAAPIIGTSTDWTADTLEAARRVQREVLTPPQAAALDHALAQPPVATVPRIIDFFHEHRLLPDAYVYGFAWQWKFGRQRAAFFNGEFSRLGWRSFFPYTFAVKTPLIALALLALAVAALTRRGGALYDTLPLWMLAAVVGAAAVLSHVDIGHRYLLPIYPPLFVLGGAVALGWRRPELREESTKKNSRASAFVLGGLLAALAVETLCWFPNYLAYFNGLVTPRAAYRHLVDSSLDWGQDLPGVKRYLDAHPSPASLAYFGVGNPDAWGIAARKIFSSPAVDLNTSAPILLLALPRTTAEATVRAARSQGFEFFDIGANGDSAIFLRVKASADFALQPGMFFISATLLQPVLYEINGPWGPWNERFEKKYQELKAGLQPYLTGATTGTDLLKIRDAVAWQAMVREFEEFRFARLTAYLRQREPDDNINYSILVYRLTEADLSRALDGPPPELGPDVPVLLWRRGELLTQ